jgi:hypothetical protein
MTTPNALATLTLEVWRASGARTEARRDALCSMYAESYFGPSSKWSTDIMTFVATAKHNLRQRTRIDELKYT